MMDCRSALLLVIFASLAFAEDCCGEDETGLEAKRDSWTAHPMRWPLASRIPATPESDTARKRDPRGKLKVKKKIKKFLLPLLLAYKLKFFTLIPVLIGGLVLLTGATGLAGFFFALFAAVMGLKAGGSH